MAGGIQGCGHISRRLSQQDTQRIHGLVITKLQSRNCRKSIGKQGTRLLYVQLSYKTAIETILSDFQGPFLDGNALFSQNNPFFIGAYQKVGPGNICRQKDHNVIIICDSGQKLCISRFDATPEFSPEIKFPGGIHANAQIFEMQISTTGVRGMATCSDSGSAGSGLLLLRIEVTSSNPQLRPRFQDAQPCYLQIEVLLIGIFDQFVEDGVIENCPPFFMMIWCDS